MAAGPGRNALGSAVVPLFGAALAACLVLAPAASGRSVAAAQSAPEAQAPGGLGVHVVQSGETFFTLASRYGMSVQDLAVLNAMAHTATLLPGRGLWVPLEQASNARAAEPAQSNGAGAGSSSAPSMSITAAETTVESANSSTTYVVQPGDTLYAIAFRFGTGVETLKAANGLPYDGSIRAGEVLIVEGGGTVPQPSESWQSGPAADGSGGASSQDLTTTEIVVSPGDTLTAIAERYGTTAANLARLNNITPDELAAGQSLQIPRPGSGTLGTGGAKKIEVDVSDQRMYVWEGGQLAYNWPASTGMAGYGTRRGTFAIQSKIPNAWSSAWQLWMPNWLGIYWAGGSENGIHALPIINGTRIWGGFLGTPISYGCIVIGTDESRLLFHWSELGIPVEIHD